MGKDELSLRSDSLRKRSASYGTARLGDVLGELTDGLLTYSNSVFGPVVELWEQLLPAELREHCRISDIRSGRLRVIVDCSAYMYELSLCKSELLRELKSRCPRAKIKNIIFAVG